MMAEDKAVEDISLLERKIIRQIEYYFGDINLPKDKFMKEKQKEDDGWISIECLTTFNRLKMLSTDFDEIKAALKKSNSGLLEIHEEDYKIRRSLDKPLPDADDPVVKMKSKMKSLYMKGFPLTYKLDDIESFLNNLGVFTSFIRMRKDPEHNFKGSIFVELTTQEEADKLLNNKELKCEDTPLIVMKREDYFSKKQEERASKPKQQGSNEEENVKIVKGAVLFIKGIGEETKREAIKELFQPHEHVSWVDYSVGDKQGHVRFANEGAAQRALDAAKAANDGKIVVEESECEVKVLEGEEEENFWKMAREDDKKRFHNRNQRGRSNRGRQRNRGGSRNNFAGRKRSWEDSKKATEDEDSKPQNEHKKFASDDEGNEDNTIPEKKSKVSDIDGNEKPAEKSDDKIDTPSDAKKQKLEANDE